MGKRKSSSKPMVKKRADPLAVAFKCVFCSRDKAITVKMDKQEMYGHLNCKHCGQRWSCPINNLSAPIDVYCDWKDACEEVNEKYAHLKTTNGPKKPSQVPDNITHGVGGGAAYSAGGRALERDADSPLDDGDADRSDREERDDVDEEKEARDLAKEKRRRVEVDSEDEDDD